MQNKNIALFFGSFNPIHNAHLMIAEQIINTQLTDEVWFVVSPHNPLKHASILADVEHRLAMTKLATADNHKFSVSDIELTLPRPSYTIDTLNALQQQNPNLQFSIIIGADNLRDFHKWRNSSTIINNYSIIVYPRPEISISNLPLSTHHNIKILNTPLSNISSTEIRTLIKQGITPTPLLPHVVINYIITHSLYK